MAVSEQISCDVCGAVKGDTNHWLVAITPQPGTEEPEQKGIAFGTLNALLSKAADEDDLKIEHLCGEACAHTRLSQFLESLRTT
jgi:hypothetical protein